MKTGRVLLSFAGVLVLLLASGAAYAQTPRDLGTLVALDREPTAEQQSRITEYASYWLGQLRSDNPRNVEQGANKLVDPANDALSTTIFRLRYSRAVLEQLRNVVREGEDFQAVQAVKVIGFLRTTDALDAIVVHLNPAEEPRWRVRLWAAKGARMLLQHAATDDVAGQAPLEAAIRLIGQGGALEDNWVVLLRNFEALASVSRTRAREQQVALLEATINRMMSQPEAPSELMLATCRALDGLLLQFVDSRLGRAEQQQFGIALAPQLARVYQLADMHWQQARNNPAMRAAYGKAIEGSDKLLTLIDTSLVSAAPANRDQPRLRPAWDNDNKQQFTASFQTWNSLISRPPYR